jgi:hypothetical protein
MRADIYLPGTPRNANPFKLCDGQCQSAKPPEGGVQISPTKWVCASCWPKFRLGRK